MSLIMISYRGSQREKARELEQKANARGFEVWLFEDNKPFKKTIVGNYSNAIAKADFVFVLLSEDYWESGHTKQELKQAIQRGIQDIKSLEDFVFLITPDNTDHTRYMKSDFSALAPLNRYAMDDVDALLAYLAPSPSLPPVPPDWKDTPCIEFATRNLKRITPQDTVSDALFIMEGARIRHLIVERQNIFKGIVSRRDIEKLLADPNNANVPVEGNAMTPYHADTNVFRYARETTPIRQVIKWFFEPIVLGNKKKYISAIPILANNQRCVGIISYIDIIKLMKRGDIPIPQLEVRSIMRTLAQGIYIAPVRRDNKEITLSDIYHVHIANGTGVRTIPVIENANSYRVDDNGVGYITLGMVTDHTIYMQLGNQEATKWLVTDERLMHPINRLDTITARTQITTIIENDLFLRAPRPDALLVVAQHNGNKILKGILSYVDIFSALLT